LVALCVNDVIAKGAEPLFFMDYYATGRMEVSQTVELMEGIAEGCRRAGCTFISGEKADLPGLFSSGEFDIAGFAVGVADRSNLPSCRKHTGR